MRPVRIIRRQGAAEPKRRAGALLQRPPAIRPAPGAAREPRVFQAFPVQPAFPVQRPQPAAALAAPAPAIAAGIAPAAPPAGPGIVPPAAAAPAAAAQPRYKVPIAMAPAPRLCRPPPPMHP